MGSAPVESQQRAAASGGPQTFRSPTALVIWWVWLLFAAANLIDLAVQGRDHLSLVAAAILLLVTGVAYAGAQRPRVITDDAGLTIRNPLRDHRIGWAGVTKVDVTDLLRVHCERPGQPASAGHDQDKRTKAIDCWAVHYSRRRKLAAEARARRSTARMGSGRSSFGLSVGSTRGGFGSSPTDTTDEAQAEKVIRVLDEHATAARAEAVWAGGTVEIAGADHADHAAQTADQSSQSARTADQSAQAARTADQAAGGSQARAADPEAAAGLEQLRDTGWLEPLTSRWSWSAIAALVIPALILVLVCLV